MDATTIIQVSGIGYVRVQRHGTAILVCLGDMLRGIGHKTPAKVVAQSAAARISARLKTGRNVLHMIDVASAIALIGAAKSIDDKARIAAIQGLMDAYAHNVGAETIPEAAKTRRRRPNSDPADRPDGVTVAEALRAMGMDPTKARTAAKYVSEKYIGERDHHPDGVIFADREQVAEILSLYGNRHRSTR